MSLQEFSTNALADMSNMALHFLHPLSKHDHSCFCLLCASEECRGNQRENKKLQAASLIPLPTSSDLDLIRTGSHSVRQLVVFDSTKSVHLQEFVSQLQIYMNYHVSFNQIPSIIKQAQQQEQSFVPYHILVVLFANSIEIKQKEWLENIQTQNLAKRLVIICSDSEPGFVHATLKMTCIRYKNYIRTLQMLVHGMMVTKHRLMPKDLPRFLQPFNSAIATFSTLHQGFCLFF